MILRYVGSGLCTAPRQALFATQARLGERAEPGLSPVRVTLKTL